MATDAPTHSCGDRVVLTKGLRGVPDGTPGRVMMAVGLTWVRYRVHFDNGFEVGSIDGARLRPE